jgi:chitinase
MNSKIIGYWGGYFDSDITLDLTPDFYDYVILAFSGPTNHNTVTTEFLCSKYSEDTIIKWIKTLQSRGIKVLMSIIDSPTVHWDQVNIPNFANSVKEIILDKWGCDGLDIDAESGMANNYISNFILLATELKRVLNNKILTYTCYTGTQGPDGEILKHINDFIDWVQIMAYFDDFDDMISLYNDYNTIVKEIVIGVKAGTEFTLLPEVEKLCKWKKGKKGIMLWTINRDTESFTGYPKFTWSNTIKNNIN